MEHLTGDVHQSGMMSRAEIKEERAAGGGGYNSVIKQVRQGDSRKCPRPGLKMLPKGGMLNQRGVGHGCRRQG